MVKTKKRLNLKEKKDDTLLMIVILVGVGFLLLNYTGVPTGGAARVRMEKELHNQLNAGMSVPYGGYQIYFYGITENGDAKVTVDCEYNPNYPDECPIKVAWTSGCAFDDVGTFIGSGIDNEYGIPYGLNVKVCSSSYSRQEADLDFSL